MMNASRNQKWDIFWLICDKFHLYEDFTQCDFVFQRKLKMKNYNDSFFWPFFQTRWVE